MIYEETTKSKKQIFLEYTRTIFCSILTGIIITSSLAIHSRNEMIKNIYQEAAIQKKIDKETALKLISQSNLLEDLNAACKEFSESRDKNGSN